MLGGDVDLALMASNPAAYNSSSPPSMLPGDIAFSTLDWFGTSGTNVVFTASASDSVVVFPRNNSTVPPPPVPQRQAPDAPVTWTLEASTANPAALSSGGSSLVGWQLAVAIAGSIIGAALIVLAVALFIFRGRQQHSTPKVGIDGLLSGVGQW